MPWHWRHEHSNENMVNNLDHNNLYYVDFREHRRLLEGQTMFHTDKAHVQGKVYKRAK